MWHVHGNVHHDITYCDSYLCHMCKSGFRNKKIIALYYVLQQQHKIINDKYNKPYEGGSYFELRSAILSIKS